MANEKIYVGNGKLIKFDGGGYLINMTMDLTDMIAAAKEYAFGS